MEGLCVRMNHLNIPFWMKVSMSFFDRNNVWVQSLPYLLDWQYFVACLGLFALAAFTAEQRTKEIGIRKVMGASVSSLAVMLSREFTKLVLIAFLPAAVAGWYVSNHWLESFAYRVTINPVIIISSGVVAIFVAWITVSFQSIKAATSNPINSLRYE